MIGFDASLPMLLNRTLDAVMPAFRELFAQYDLTEPQWRILRVLWDEPKMTSAHLAERTLIPFSSLVGVLDRLERKELVARIRSTTDRRVVHVVATSKGRALEKDMMPAVDAINARLHGAVSPTEWAAMETILNRIATDGVGMQDLKTERLPLEGRPKNRR